MQSVLPPRRSLHCARCGYWIYSRECVHNFDLAVSMTDEEAQRVQARYALGKRCNPDHDTTIYRDLPDTTTMKGDYDERK